MNICMVTNEFPPLSGGIGYYVYNLSKRLLQRQCEVTVITRGSTFQTSKAVMEGIDVFRLPFFPLYPFHIWIHGIFVSRLFKSLESEFTLVHLHTPLIPPIGTSLPVITTVHTPMKIDSRYHEVFNLTSLAEKAQSSAFYPRIESRLFRSSNKITAVSQCVAEELKEYGLDPKEIAIVGNGVDIETFTPIKHRDCSEIYILYTGILRARKGLFDLIECARHVCRVYPNMRFIITGKGPFLNKLVEEVRLKGLEGKVVFLGYVKRRELIRIYQNASIHVVPSHYEGMPTVLLEAMACGLPVVATDIGGNNEVISSGVNGFLVPPKRPENMAKIIIKLLNNATLRERIGRSARITIERHYTWDKITDRILECYRSIM